MKNSNLSTMISALPGDAQAGAPLYAQVKQAVLDALSHGEWKQGEAIPPEKQLAERFGVSIGTLRKAIDELSSENILVRQQGRGTYVAIHNRNHHFFKFFRVVGQDGVKTYPVTTLLKFRRLRATGPLRDALQLDTGDQVFEFSNRLVLNGDVVMVDTITVPEPRFRGLTEQMLRERPSTLYNFYQDAFNINVIATDERLRACSADEIHAGWLDVAVGAPLLEVRRLAYSYNREPVEWRVSRVNTEKYEYLGQAPGTPPAS
ncbi:GntR family transcriptional regulator [Pigmentiphaga litoralis]|uniref:GntR family transcriptional regulator n=2 Tax=Pigmentiphaga litoralis TaxID=516702 RepID=A0A7Y9IT21_9BURK|nr:GntR family transcriptional regulator [Pigmentiphaga litoralis]NYE82522.1 GntR family transcriptional regulator [Pigmentiphaga litoralis]